MPDASTAAPAAAPVTAYLLNANDAVRVLGRETADVLSKAHIADEQGVIHSLLQTAQVGDRTRIEAELDAGRLITQDAPFLEPGYLWVRASTDAERNRPANAAAPGERDHVRQYLVPEVLAPRLDLPRPTHYQLTEVRDARGSRHRCSLIDRSSSTGAMLERQIQASNLKLTPYQPGPLLAGTYLVHNDDPDDFALAHHVTESRPQPSYPPIDLTGVITVLIDQVLADEVLGAGQGQRLPSYIFVDNANNQRALPALIRQSQFDALVTASRHTPLTFLHTRYLPHHVRIVAKDPDYELPGEERPDETPEAPLPPSAQSPEPGQRGNTAAAFSDLETALSEVLTQNLERLKRERRQSQEEVRAARARLLHHSRREEALGRQIAALESRHPRQLLSEGIQRLTEDGVITEAASAPAVGRSGHRIVLTTPPLICTRDSDGATFDIGRFELQIDFVNGDVGFRNLDQKHPSFIHPHVAEGGACFGNAAEAIQEMIAQFEIVALTGLLIDFLSNANADDPWGSTVAQWPKVAEGDGTPVDPPEPEIDPDDARDPDDDFDEEVDDDWH